MSWLAILVGLFITALYAFSILRFGTEAHDKDGFVQS